MGKNTDVDCSFTEENKIFKRGGIADLFKHFTVSRHFFCTLPKCKKSFCASCPYSVFKNRNNLFRLHEPGPGLSGFPPKAAVTALISADIGYRDENVF
ncbi:hypothetical protein DSECCO2_603080 [anaerobic digester metagenome]